MDERLENREVILVKKNIQLQNRRRIFSVIALLCLVAAIFVFSWLKLTGITVTGGAFCQKEEHSHSGECFSSSLLCENTNESHVHEEVCYENLLVCPLEEHTHEVSCYSDMDADKETAADWEKAIDKSQLSESAAENLLYVAETQLGYRESEVNFVSDDSGNKQGYTRYGEWYGNPYGKWSAMFLSFCLNYAEVKEAEALGGTGSEALRLSWNEKGLYTEAAFYTPKVGEVVFVDLDENGSADTLGILRTAEEGKFTAILGDYENAVAEVDLSEVNVMGYGSVESLKVALTKEPTVDEDGDVITETTAPEEETTSNAAPSEDNNVAFEDLYPENKERVQNVINLIDTLPSYENIAAKVAEFQDNDDVDGEAEYINKIAVRIRTAYAYYEELEDLQKYVRNKDKLVDVYQKLAKPFFETQSLAITSAITVYQINSYTSAANFISYGGNTQRFTSMSFTYWDVYFFEFVENKTYKCYNAITTYVVKNNHSPVSNGFLLYIYNGNANGLAVGDYVTIDFALATKEYNASGVGNISKGSAPPAPYDPFSTIPNNEDDVQLDPDIVETKSFLTINLFDYGNGINTLYNSDQDYPGFQQEYGAIYNGGYTTMKRISAAANFGNNITADLGAGINGVTSGKPVGNINATNKLETDSTKANINRPIGVSTNNVVMHPVMIDGFPAQKSGVVSNQSLRWLFEETPAYTVTQANKNRGTIDKLFKYDSQTGVYSFNSRENHAQYNSETNEFEVYKQILTPNFILYPFGNFIPFNDIKTQATKLSSINSTSDYFKNIGERAAKRATLTSDTTVKNAYDKLATQMPLMNSDLNSVKSNWVAKDIIDGYMANIPPAGTVTFPFVSGDPFFDNTYNVDYDFAADFYFGMDIHTTLIQPKDGMTGVNDEHLMYFKFTGDDDVWVYLDRVLFLDLSGIHRHVGGAIDFQKGIVYYSELDPETGDIKETEAYKTYTFEEILNNAGRPDLANALVPATVGTGKTFKNYSAHKFDFYYMERGSGSSVCRIEFNFPLLKKNTISVMKEVEIEGGEHNYLGTPKFAFQIVSAETEEPLPGTVNQDFTIYKRDSDEVVGSGRSDANGIFWLKKDERAVFEVSESAGNYFVRELLEKSFYTQYEKVYVDGDVVEFNEHEKPELSHFYGYKSKNENISDGGAFFNYVNHIDPTKFGALSVTKTVVEVSEYVPQKDYTFTVKLDDALVPVGTAYEVTDKNGNLLRTETISEAGRITLTDGETATIKGILAGTTFEVTEDAVSGYLAEYTVDGTNANHTSATGRIKVSTDQLVVTESEVKNIEQGSALPLKITKKLEGADNIERTFNFEYYKITSPRQTGMVLNTEKVPFTVTTSPETGVGEATIYLGINAMQDDTTNNDHFFLVREKPGDDVNTDYDTIEYIVAVHAEKVAGALNLTYIGAYTTPPLTQLTDVEIVDGAMYLPFTNTLSRSLSLTKNVIYAEGYAQEENLSFNYRITVNDKDGNGLNGEYPFTIVDSNGSPVETPTSAVTFYDGYWEYNGLKPGELLTINGLPAGSTFTIVEDNISGWEVFNKVGISGEVVACETAEGSVNENPTVYYTNRKGFVLPETGGSGTLIYTIGGLALMLIPLLYYILSRRKERRAL